MKVFKFIRGFGVFLGVSGFLVGLGAAMASDSEQWTGDVRPFSFYLTLAIVSVVMMFLGYNLNRLGNEWVRYLEGEYDYSED